MHHVPSEVKQLADMCVATVRGVGVYVYVGVGVWVWVCLLPYAKAI